MRSVAARRASAASGTSQSARPGPSPTTVRLPARPPGAFGPPVLAVQGLEKIYRSGGMFGRRRIVHAVRGVDFTLRQG